MTSIKGQSTLPKQTTALFFNDADGFNRLKEHWGKVIANPDAKKNLLAADFLFYQALRGKDYRKGFTHVVNRTKLENGAHLNQGLRKALIDLNDSNLRTHIMNTMGGLVKQSALDAIINFLPAPSMVEDRNLFSVAPYISKRVIKLPPKKEEVAIRVEKKV